MSNWIIITTSKLDEDENAINENHENDIELKEGSQGSGQNGNQTNENIYESLPLPGNPGNDKELKEDAISHGHLGGIYKF